MAENPPLTVDQYITRLALSCEDLRRQAGQASIELRAALFAVRSHGDQAYGDHPYIAHLHAVREVLRTHKFEGDIATAAWLHDVLEDTTSTRKQVADEFGEGVETLVWAVTGEGPSRKARNAGVYQKIRNWPQVAPLKLADRIANVSACVSSNRSSLMHMYQSEHAEFRQAIARFCPTEMWAVLEALIR